MLKFEEREPVILHNNGSRLFGVIHRPLTKDKFPAVLFCHGLAGNKTGRYRVYVDFAERLSVLGIGVLRLDFSGSGDSEGKFIDMTLSGEISDAQTGLDYLLNDPSVDSKRIGIFGRSLGGLIAIMLAEKHASKVKALALWSSIYSGDQWQEMYDRVRFKIASPEESEIIRTVNGQVAGEKFYDELFSINSSEIIQNTSHIPLLHLHGEKDNLVTAVHAERYKKAREGSSASSEFILFPNSDHDLSYRPERLKAIEITSAWFKKNL